LTPQFQKISDAVSPADVLAQAQSWMPLAGSATSVFRQRIGAASVSILTPQPSAWKAWYRLLFIFPERPELAEPSA
jgi:hypothetical protein